MPSNVRDEITYPFPNFNGCTIEVWKWISNFIQHFIMGIITYKVGPVHYISSQPLCNQHVGWLEKLQPIAKVLKPHNDSNSNPSVPDCCVIFADSLTTGKWVHLTSKFSIMVEFLRSFILLSVLLLILILSILQFSDMTYVLSWHGHRTGAFR